MSDRPISTTTAAHDGTVWPCADYAAQVEALRAAVGREIHIAEVRFDGLAVSVVLDGRPRRLLAVVDFPAPDPARDLYPHMLVLDDGHGINLGRVARVSLDSAFEPPPAAVLFGDPRRLDSLLYAERTLTRERTAAIAQEHLSGILGRGAEKRRLR